jgi:bacterioferritin (cytochrome b1)
MKRKNPPQSEMQNRTGVLVAPDLAQELVEGVNEGSPKPFLEQSAAAAMRSPYMKAGLPIGSYPQADDDVMVLLMDKLGARLAFERSGVRLYEALIQKLEAAGRKSEVPLRDLQQIRDEELQHMAMLERHILALGGDPTMVTPAADVSATMNSGVLKVVTDPRTTVPQCLEGILTAELVDNDCWDVLVAMSTQQGMDVEAEDFQQALAEEQEHLAKVRKWVLTAATIPKG